MSEEGYITLYQFTKKIEGALRDPAIRSQWITLEINSISVHHASGHCYLEAVEKSPTGTTIASAKANIWASSYSRLSTKFKAATGMDLQRGMKILANVSVNYHSLYGLSLNISDIDPTFTLGESERLRRETMQRLRDDGIWDMNRSLGIEDLITRIAVVSSPTAAGYGDFCRQIEESGLRIGVTLFDSLMQGNQAEKSITDSLARICKEIDKYDAIVIIRGGGATGDMDCFDGYMVCSAIAQMPLPVITGIGHDRDTSIADMVAAVPLKTPTAVAAWVIDRIWDYVNTMERCCSEINSRAKNLLLEMWNALENNTTLLAGTAGWILSEKNLQMAECKNQLTRAASAVAVGENAKLARYDQMIKTVTTGTITARIGRIGILEQNLLAKWNRVSAFQTGEIDKKMQMLGALTKNTLERNKNSLGLAVRTLSGSIAIYREKALAKATMLENTLKEKTGLILKIEKSRYESLCQILLSHDPKNVLGRGYALLKKNGKVVPSAVELNVGENIEIILRDAVLESEIKKIK